MSSNTIKYMCLLVVLTQSSSAVILKGQSYSALRSGELTSPNDFSSTPRPPKVGQGVLVLDGSSSYQGVVEVTSRILIFDKVSYDPIRDLGNDLILRNGAKILPQNLIYAFPQAQLQSFEASSTAIVPERSTTGLLVGLLSAAYIFFNRRNKARL